MGNEGWWSPRDRKTDDVSPNVTPAYRLGIASRLQCRWGDPDRSSGTPELGWPDWQSGDTRVGWIRRVVCWKRATHRENPRFVQRIPLKHSAEYWSATHAQGGLRPRKELSKWTRKRCPALAQSQKWCLLPPSDCKNIIHRILSRIPRKLMAQ